MIIGVVNQHLEQHLNIVGHAVKRSITNIVSKTIITARVIFYIRTIFITNISRQKYLSLIPSYIKRTIALHFIFMKYYHTSQKNVLVIDQSVYT